MVNISSLPSLGSEESWEVMCWGPFGVVHAAVCLVHMS